MASIYDITFNLAWKNLFPPNKRGAKFLAWGRVMMKPLQWLRDLFYTEYADGYTGLIYSNSTLYFKGDRVRYIDRSVYEAIGNPPLATLPTDVAYWIKIQDVWIGARERIKYNGQKIVLEYALNKWFDTVFRYAPSLSDIYITNNILDNGFSFSETEGSSDSFAQSEAYTIAWLGNDYDYTIKDFTIYVPVAVYNALSTDPSSREPIVRAFADRYVIAGITYNVVTY